MYKFLTAILVIMFCIPAGAQSQGDQLGKCLADNTTGRDRKNLARWTFLAMAAHPEIRDLANPSSEAIEKSNQTIGRLVTRLFTENCSKEVRLVAKGEGTQAMAKAFEALGQLAMMELISNSNVTASISGFEHYVDKEKVNAVLTEK